MKKSNIEITRGVTPVDIHMAQGFPGGINFPQNVPCPNRCKFCYEAQTSKLFPWVKVKYVAPFTENIFASYLREAQKIASIKEQQIKQGSLFPFLESKGHFFYFPKCDFFSLGLNLRQIETILKYGKPMIAYTTGFNVDISLIKYLIDKYPHKLNFHLSIITFDSHIRSRLMNPQINTKALKKLCTLIKNSTYFLLNFNQNQLAADVDFLIHFLNKNNNKLAIAKMYYNKLSPVAVKQYAKDENNKFRNVVEYLKQKKSYFNNIDAQIILLPDAKTFAWARKRQIHRLFKSFEDIETSIVFCTKGAYEVIREFVKRAHVIQIGSCYGGNIDFVLGMTAQEIITEVEKLQSCGIALKHIYLPDRMFSISNQYDFNLHTIQKIANTFPRLKITMIRIPFGLVDTVLTLKECIAYYAIEQK